MAILFFTLGQSRRAALGRWRVVLAVVIALAAAGPVRAQRIVTVAARTQADTLFQQAYTAYEGGDYAQAHRLIDQAEKLHPDQADGCNLRGAVYLKQGMYDRATASFVRAIELDPKLWAAQFNLGEVAFHKKDYRHARERFEALLNQTDHFKEANRWELAAYKVYLSTLLMGDDASARKKLAKLPAKGGTTPAYLYAQAALSYSRKDAATAEKTLATAQAAYPAAANNLFGSSFETVGWITPAPMMPANPSSLPLPGGGPAAGTGGRGYQVDPRLEAAVADPLPSPGGAIYGNMPGLMATGERGGKQPPHRSSPEKAPAPATKEIVPAPPSLQDDHMGLLLQ